MFSFFDSHCHPQLAAFDADRDEVLSRMVVSNVGGLVVGTDLKESTAAVSLAHTRDFLWAAVGLHPTDRPNEVFNEEAFRVLAEDSRVVAIGECGLDFFREEKTQVYDMQCERFELHITLAQLVGKPLVIHCRSSQGSVDAQEEMLRILKSHNNPKAIMHFFTSTVRIAERYLALGCYLSFPGPITFTDMYDEIIRLTPTDKILVETDSPFAAPMPYRGQRNEPSYVQYTVHKIAVVKNIPVEELQLQLVKNAYAAFSLR